MGPSSTASGLPLPLAVGLFYLVVLLRGGGTYALGRGARSGAGRSRVKARLETPRFRRVERLVERFGAPIVAVSFLTVGFQTLANLAAGVLRMPLPAYLPALAVGGFAWALIWGVGVATYEAVAALGARSPLEATVFVVIVVILVTIEVFTVRRSRRREVSATAQSAVFAEVRFLTPQLGENPQLGPPAGAERPRTSTPTAPPP